MTRGTGPHRGACGRRVRCDVCGGLCRCRLQGLARSICPPIQGSGVGLFTHSPLLAGLAFLPRDGEDTGEQLRADGALRPPACGLALLGREKGSPPPSTESSSGQDEGLRAVVGGWGFPHASAENQASVQSPQDSRARGRSTAAGQLARTGTSCRVVGRPAQAPGQDAGGKGLAPRP